MSDIFNAYVKLMQDRAKTASAEHTEKSFKETNPRHDSLSIEQISKLYNTKPDTLKDMQYERNIMEDAHPVPVVLMPAYDRLNGLVENENEGQAIRVNITNKVPDGLSLLHRYAQKEFVHSLVDVANELDKQNQTGLLALADACLLQMAGKPIEKQGIGHLAIGLGVAAVVGVLYAQQHLPMHSDGFDADYQKVIAEIDDIIDSDHNPIFVGYSYTPQFIQMMSGMKTELSKLYDAYHKVLPELENVEQPHNRADYVRIARHSTTQSAVQALQEFKTVVREVWPYFSKVMANFSNAGFKQRAITGKGMLSSMVDYTNVLHGGWGLISDDFDDIVHAMKTLQGDVKNVIKSLPTKSEVDAAVEQIQISDAELDERTDDTIATPMAAPATPAPAAPAKEVAPKLEEQLQQFMKQHGMTSDQLKKLMPGS